MRSAACGRRSLWGPQALGRVSMASPTPWGGLCGVLNPREKVSVGSPNPPGGLCTLGGTVLCGLPRPFVGSPWHCQPLWMGVSVRLPAHDVWGGVSLRFNRIPKPLWGLHGVPKPFGGSPQAPVVGVSVDGLAGAQTYRGALEPGSVFTSPSPRTSPQDPHEGVVQAPHPSSEHGCASAVENNRAFISLTIKPLQEAQVRSMARAETHGGVPCAPAITASGISRQHPRRGRSWSCPSWKSCSAEGSPLSPCRRRRPSRSSPSLRKQWMGERHRCWHLSGTPLTAGVGITAINQERLKPFLNKTLV